MNAIAKLEPMCEMEWLEAASAAIAKVETIAEAKDIADKASAIKLIAAKQNWSSREKARLAEIEIRATARLGELLAQVEKAKGGEAYRKGGKPTGSHREPVLADLGVTKKQSHIAQRIASLPKADLEKAIAEPKPSLAKTLLRAHAKKQKRITVAASTESAAIVERDLQAFINRKEKFACIYADPPWRYGNQGTRGSTDDHYQTMSVEAICELPIKQIAEKAAHLHLWTTNAFLFDARRVMEAWGFEYASCFVWVKPQMGMGNYWRVSHEFMLLGIRGDAPFQARNQMSWAELPRGRHSAKPDKIRKRIELVSPGPRIELFARDAFEGWSAWGNQTKHSLFTAGSGNGK